MVEERRAFGFVRSTHLEQSGMEMDVVRKEGDQDSRSYARTTRKGWTRDELSYVMYYLRTHKEPSQDAWEILLALFPEDRTFLEWYMQDRMTFEILGGSEQ